MATICMVMKLKRYVVEKESDESKNTCKGTLTYSHKIFTNSIFTVMHKIMCHKCDGFEFKYTLACTYNSLLSLSMTYSQLTDGNQ